MALIIKSFLSEFETLIDYPLQRAIDSMITNLYLYLSCIVYCIVQWTTYGVSILDETTIPKSSDVVLSWDPPDTFVSITGLGVFTRCRYTPEPDADIKIYYEIGAAEDSVYQNATLDSLYATNDSPYIALDTPFKASRNRILTLICVIQFVNDNKETEKYRSQQVTLNYVVEASARPYAHGFLVPGVESSGMFIKFQLEVAAKARAQTAGGQEFANFFSYLGKGTYEEQVRPLNLTKLIPDLIGFEGGFPVNFSNGEHYGILVPYHNGKDFHGMVVRVDTNEGMEDLDGCLANYRIERMLANGTIDIEFGENYTVGIEPCIAVLDLASVHPYARGFRKGFMGFPYAYLAPGAFNVLVRLDTTDFTLNATKFIDLQDIDSTYGGYSGGFTDGTWACYNPFRSFSGPIGGIRSTLAVDANQLRPYYYGVMLCVNETAWNIPYSLNESYAVAVKAQMRELDFSNVLDKLRGFSEVIRVGRFAYVAPLSYSENVYSSFLVRISLGDVDIGTTLTEVGSDIRSIINILDMSKLSDALRGYSGLFTAGQYLFLCPYRNAYEPQNGQRGHGTLTRLDMNDFSLSGLDYIDLPTAERAQVPSFADVNFRGFSGGFACKCISSCNRAMCGCC